MSKFESNYGTTITIKEEDGEIFIDLGGMTDVLMRKADAPALALAILEAAGVDVNAEFPQNALEDAAESLGTHIRVAAAKAERDAEEAEALAAVETRRNELAGELAQDGAYAYRFAGPDLQRAIDRIIELEARA